MKNYLLTLYDYKSVCELFEGGHAFPYYVVTSANDETEAVSKFSKVKPMSSNVGDDVDVFFLDSIEEIAKDTPRGRLGDVSNSIMEKRQEIAKLTKEVNNLCRLLEEADK